MTIKVVKLKSGEDIIADVQEVQDKESKVRQAFIFTHAYTCLLYTSDAADE